MLTEQKIHVRESAPRREIKRILCPTDLSNDSDQALRYAVALAREFQAKLFVCYCVERSNSRWHDYVNGLYHIKGLFEESLAPYVSAADQPQLEWESVIVEGEAAQAINRAAADNGVDLIVMNSRRRPMAAALLGSTAESVCRTAPCPVLVRHAPEREWVDISTGKIELKRILIAHDFTDYSEVALAYALSLAQEYCAELHLLHVMASSPERAWYPPEEGVMHGVTRRLQYLVPAEVHNWCEVKLAVREGTPHREILKYAGEQNIGLICVGAHGKGFAEWLPFGSNTDRVLRQADCPVFVARPLAAEKQ